MTVHSHTLSVILSNSDWNNITVLLLIWFTVFLGAASLGIAFAALIFRSPWFFINILFAALGLVAAFAYNFLWSP